MKKVVTIHRGEIYAIPLFISNIPDNKRIAKSIIDDNQGEFAFCRIIEDMQGGGFLIEVFDLVGGLKTSLENIVSSNRLFKPIAISGLGIYKKRWKKLYLQIPYDKEKDSKYSKIQLVIGAGEDLRLWRNAIETSISEEEARHYEKWIVWRASQLEKRIIQELSSRN